MTTTEQKDLIKPRDEKLYAKAILVGQEALTKGGNKADAARAIHEVLKGEERDVIVRAFVEGAGLTEKGAPTYFYNIQRNLRRSKPLGKQTKPKGDLQNSQ